MNLKTKRALALYSLYVPLTVVMIISASMVPNPPLVVPFLIFMAALEIIYIICIYREMAILPFLINQYRVTGIPVEIKPSLKSYFSDVPTAYTHLDKCHTINRSRIHKHGVFSVIEDLDNPGIIIVNTFRDNRWFIYQTV